MLPLLPKDWQKPIQKDFDLKKLEDISQFLDKELKLGKEIYPVQSEVFSAFEATPLKKVKVVIIGQDPYHGPGQAHGMSFSVKKGIKIPPSLKNIYKEIHRDLLLPIPEHGNLLSWANQGVLLLNNVLTVEKGKAASHRKKGWEEFTDRVIEVLNQEKENLVFLLWGAPAQKKASMVDKKKHLVLEAPHPSPLSAHRGFHGCGHFSKCNKFLKEKELSPIDWNIA